MTEFSYKLVENEEELLDAYEVRRLVFVVEQGIAEDLVFEGTRGDDEINVVVKNKETVIGTARVMFPTYNTAKIERMAVLPNFRQKGIGRNIIAFLHEELKCRGIKNVVLHAQHQVIIFYKSCGFREKGRTFKEAGIQHIQMEMHY